MFIKNILTLLFFLGFSTSSFGITLNHIHWVEEAIGVISKADAIKKFDLKPLDGSTCAYTGLESEHGSKGRPNDFVYSYNAFFYFNDSDVLTSATFFYVYDFYTKDSIKPLLDYGIFELFFSSESDSKNPYSVNIYKNKRNGKYFIYSQGTTRHDDDVIIVNSEKLRTTPIRYSIATEKDLLPAFARAKSMNLGCIEGTYKSWK